MPRRETAPGRRGVDAPARRLFAYTGGFLYPGRVRRILSLAGHDIGTGLPGAGDHVVVWGRSRHAWRGEAVAARRGAGLVRVEDAFLRSVHPGRRGRPLGLLIDATGGVHFDPSRPSAVEALLVSDPLDDTALLTRARDGIARLAAGDLSKYNAHDPDLPAPAPGYVLVVDQVRGDASVRHGGADAATFRAMLGQARGDHPGARILVKAHPAGPGHLDATDFAAAGGPVERIAAPVSPHRLLAGAVAVYTVSSQLGFEAILAGHRPRVFGQPVYAGWDLSEDMAPPLPHRGRRLTRAQLFAGLMILAPTWYDPCRDRLCNFEDAVAQLEAEVRAWREDRAGHVVTGMRLWKRAHLVRHFGGGRGLRFVSRADRAAAIARADGRPLMVWAGREEAAHSAAPRLIRVEDGLLRSRGLGAALVPPLSLVADDLGIYYDPTRESRLERLIAAGPPPGGLARAEALIAALRTQRVTKYNLGNAKPGACVGVPGGGARRILVPGQVEDDASIRLGAGAERTNRALLARVRAENPGAQLIYKPHPDVAAGLRPGAVPDAGALADTVLGDMDAADALEIADEVWTITSTLGFEALIRGVAVTCLGTPFYAGWGLTRDLGPVPARRGARPDLPALVHAVLITYPRYRDPVTGLPCPAEVAVERLAGGRVTRGGPVLRLLSKAQGVLAGHAHLWR